MYSNIADSILCYTSRKTKSAGINPSDPKLNPSVIVVPSKEKGWERNQNLVVFFKVLPWMLWSVAYRTVTQVTITCRLLPQQDFVSLLLECLGHWKSFCSKSLLKCDLVPPSAPCYQTQSFRAGVQASAFPRHLLSCRIKPSVLVFCSFHELPVFAHCSNSEGEGVWRQRAIVPARSKSIKKMFDVFCLWNLLWIPVLWWWNSNIACAKQTKRNSVAF